MAMRESMNPNRLAIEAEQAVDDIKAGRATRADRQPFGTQEQKLAWPPIPGFHLHWFNDDPGRIDRAKRAGYEMVNDADGKPVQTVVGTARGGGSLLAFLMKIPQEWADEDRAANDEIYFRRMEAIRNGGVPATNGARGVSQEKQYVPQTGIAIHSDRR